MNEHLVAAGQIGRSRVCSTESIGAGRSLQGNRTCFHQHCRRSHQIQQLEGICTLPSFFIKLLVADRPTVSGQRPGDFRVE